MTRQQERYQTQWAAQFHVAAELTRRGYVIALTLGNTPRTDLLVTTPDGDTHFEVDVKGQSTRNFWLIQNREPVHNLYYVLVYLPRDVDQQPRFFILSGVEMMEKRAEYRAHIESTSDKYRDDMGGMNWKTAFSFEYRWNILPGYESLGHEEPPDRQIIPMPPITLNWSNWVAWDALKIDARGGAGVLVPNRKSGVYEARRVDAEERLTIGKATDLRMRVKQGLVKGKAPHSAGEKIRAHEDASAIVVRWATTDTPAAAEEALHKKHIKDFGYLPLYTEHT